MRRHARQLRNTLRNALKALRLSSGRTVDVVSRSETDPSESSQNATKHSTAGKMLVKRESDISALSSVNVSPDRSPLLRRSTSSLSSKESGDSGIASTPEEGEEPFHVIKVAAKNPLGNVPEPQPYAERHLGEGSLESVDVRRTGYGLTREECIDPKPSLLKRFQQRVPLSYADLRVKSLMYVFLHQHNPDVIPFEWVPEFMGFAEAMTPIGGEGSCELMSYSTWSDAFGFMMQEVNKKGGAYSSLTELMIEYLRLSGEKAIYRGIILKSLSAKINRELFAGSVHGHFHLFTTDQLKHLLKGDDQDVLYQNNRDLVESTPTGQLIKQHLKYAKPSKDSGSEDKANTESEQYKSLKKAYFDILDATGGEWARLCHPALKGMLALIHEREQDASQFPHSLRAQLENSQHVALSEREAQRLELMMEGMPRPMQSRENLDNLVNTVAYGIGESYGKKTGAESGDESVKIALSESLRRASEVDLYHLDESDDVWDELEPLSDWIFLTLRIASMDPKVRPQMEMLWAQRFKEYMLSRFVDAIVEGHAAQAFERQKKAMQGAPDYYFTESPSIQTAELKNLKVYLARKPEQFETICQTIFSRIAGSPEARWLQTQERLWAQRDLANISVNYQLRSGPGVDNLYKTLSRELNLIWPFLEQKEDGSVWLDQFLPTPRDCRKGVLLAVKQHPEICADSYKKLFKTPDRQHPARGGV
ncbi:hypothetical protein PAHA111176_10895 [Parendozoicomonas haliclonae]|uniref:Uncharacterized protein n=1 Tax=Parendozoicomonas haliclonae TaxID=1960125 RepID=A0A1X7AL05_9GAMM|nr:hypothetical protein EHSB41UT_02768 [Parendozoicomonas haliclonae]